MHQKGVNMYYRYLGKTGMKVSALCLGAMTFGRESARRTAASCWIVSQLRAATLSTRQTSTRGRIGGDRRPLAGRPAPRRLRDRHQGALPDGRRPNDLGLSRKHILANVEASLRRLGTDYIDLYQVHCWDPGTPLAETLSTLDQLVQSGKVRYIGASNYSGWQLQKAVDLSKQMGWEPFVCLQPLYNLLDRALEWELLPVCRNEGIGIIPWSPLRGGWLSGKYHRGMAAPVKAPASRRPKRPAGANPGASTPPSAPGPCSTPCTPSRRRPAKRRRRSPSTGCCSGRGVTAPIIGARSLAHFEDNLGAVGWSLSPEQVQRLTSAGNADLPYPYDFIARAAKPRQ